MAKSPKDLSKLTQADLEAISALEAYIDNSDEMLQNDVDPCIVSIPKELNETCFAVRKNIRSRELEKHYEKVGWGSASVNLNKGIIELTRTDPFYFDK